MDPLAIVSASSSLIISFVKATKSLSNIRNSFDNAPLSVLSMMTECKTISTALAHLQNLTLGNASDLCPPGMSAESVMESFDNALTGCMLVLSALDTQLQRLVEEEKPETMGFITRVRLLWNEEAMTQMLGHLRGQHTAISTLISLFQALPNKTLSPLTKRFSKSLVSLQDMLEKHMGALHSHRARSLRFYQQHDLESTSRPQRELSILNFSLQQSFSLVDATSNINTQLQQSTAYRNAGATSPDELWRRNQELNDENGTLRDKLDNLEQETDQKGRKIANLVAKVSSLQTQISSLEAQNDSLEQELQAATRAKAEQFSAYQRQLREMGATLVEQVRHDRSEIKELETRLNSLRKSHGASLISHLVEGYRTWDNHPIQAVQAPSPHSTLAESGRSSRSSREEPFPTPDTASLESADWMEGSDLIAMSKESMDDENGLSGAGA